MNNKKKNKNKQNKPPNPTPPQKEVAEAVSPPEEVTQSVVEERVPNIVSENVPEVKEPQVGEDTPKKPKRNRGKKKKEDEKSDKEDDVKVEEPIAVAPVQAVEDALADVDIAPTARKKKNKNKKNQETVPEEKHEEKELSSEVKLETSDNKSQEVPIQKVEETEPESKSSKKKKNKKKNRNDSERSEKEEISCTSAFQQLMGDDKSREKTEKEIKPISDEGNLKENKPNPEENIATDVKTEVEITSKGGSNKNKKKNKKDKKQPLAEQAKLTEDAAPPEQLKTGEITVLCGKAELPIETLEKPATLAEENIPDLPALEDINPKQKAKIAKPVEKKKKGKVYDDKNTEEKTQCDEELKSPDEGSTTVTNVAKIETILSTSDSGKVVTPVEISPDWHEEVKIEEQNVPIIDSETKETLLLPKDKAEKNKKRKKSPKPSQRKDMTECLTTEQKLETPVEKLSQESKSDAVLVVEETLSTPEDLKFTDEPQCEIKSEAVALDLPATDTKIHQTKTQPDNKSKGKKSPKVQRKNEPGSSVDQTTTTSTPKVDEKQGIESLKTYDITPPKEDISIVQKEVKPDEPIVPHPVSNVTEEVKKDELERIPTPDHEKRQKRKKSPKPPHDIEKTQGSKGKSKHGAINIDDIIIIQAEVVSEEKAKKGDTFIASAESTQTQDDGQKTEVKAELEKSKKSKKSPKPIKKDLFPEFKTVEPTELKDQPAEIQIPETPKPENIKLLPDNFPIELERPKAEPLPSPSDVTPDFIEYPRCSSEQLLDSNNNTTVIQEMTTAESKLGTLNIPDKPFVLSSLLTPEATGVKSTQADTITKTDEKTDLKSKVMEVNQDMEELRLSIERSLAELTSLDKADADNEKKVQKDKEAAEKAIQETIAAEPKVENLPISEKIEEISCEIKGTEEITTQEPVCPERKDRKGKNKSKKKVKQEVPQTSATESSTATSSTTTEAKESTKTTDDKQEEKKSDQKTEQTKEKGKQQSSGTKANKDDESVFHPEGNTFSDFEPIENFEDAMTSSVDDVNKTFEIIANEANSRLDVSQNNPEINVIAPEEDKGKRQDKQNPVSPPKNLLGHPDIPVPSNRTDYKKEKNKTPNCRQAKVKIKDLNDDHAPEKMKESKESQTDSKRRFNQKISDESICVTNKNEDYVYKYSFRKVFLQCACHVCKKDLTQSQVPCSYCNLVFYCSQKHKDEDYAQHQALCFAVSTICHLKDQKFIYADAVNITGHNYRLLRMQTIVSCEKVLKRRLAAWEQEALLYPRVCAHAACREWRRSCLSDCVGCGQISYCSDHPDHLPSTHARWCKSYNLYRALVHHQQTKGRLEPKLPTRTVDMSPMPDNINEVLASLYEERIDMNDIEYAALTQLATAPLTALYCLQAYKRTTANGVTKKSTLTLHIVGAELQFEADALRKWEVFLLHLVPHKELRVALVGPDLNPASLPLELLGKIKLCENCRQNNRRVVFYFHDKKTYHEFWTSDDFTTPDLVCAFNPGLQRSSSYGKDSWSTTISCILKLRVPFAITAHTLPELTSDLARVDESGQSGHAVPCPPRINSFASVRPDRNFISDDEAPLLFKNHCVAVVCGV